MWRNWLSENNCDGSKVLKSTHRLCNVHFAEQDICQSVPGKLKLKAEAVPSIIGSQVKAPVVDANFLKPKSDDNDSREKSNIVNVEGKVCFESSAQLPKDLLKQKTDDSTHNDSRERSYIVTIERNACFESSSQPPEILLKPKSDDSIYNESREKSNIVTIDGNACFESSEQVFKNISNIEIKSNKSCDVSKEDSSKDLNEEELLLQKKLKFLKILEDLGSNARNVSFPDDSLWTFNIVNNKGFQCVMWSLWSNDASQIQKRIVLLPNMKLLVSIKNF